MSESVTITIDLDNAEYNNSIKEIESITVESAKKTGEALEKNIDLVLNKKIVDSAEKSESSLSSLFSTLEKIVTKLTIAAPVVIFLEKRFGVFSKILGKFGLNLEKIIEKTKEFTKTFSKFLSGEKSFNSLKIAAGLLLKEFGLVDNKILSLIDNFQFLKPLFAGFAGALGVVASNAIELTQVFGKLTSNLKQTGQVLRGVAAIKFKPAGIFGVVSVLGDLSIGLGILSASLSNFDNPAAKFISKISLIASVITGGLAAALTLAINKVAEFSGKIANNLINFFDESSKNFNKLEKDVQVFNAAISSLNRSADQTVITIDSLNRAIGENSERFNLSASELRKSAQEIALVGSQIGLTSDQITELIKVSSEYAKVNKKDVFNTSVALVKALNGQADSVVNLGIKLNQASIQQFALKEGITQSITSLSEAEKVQLRYNKLLDQYGVIAGVGEVAAASLSDQNERLEENIKSVNTALGEGARIIESNNLLAFAYNKILDNVSQTVFKAVGFFGALGARLLQAGSLFLDLGFKLFILNKTIKITNFLLNQTFTQDLINKRIPLLGISFSELTKQISGSNIELKSFKDVLLLLTSTVRNQFSNVLVSLTGKSKESLTAFSALSGIIRNLASKFRVLLLFLAPVGVALAKFAAVGALIIGPFIAIGKAFQEVERRTGALSQTYNILLAAFLETKSIFQPVIDLFNQATEAITNLVNKGFGLLVDGVSSVISSFAALAKSNPFGVFSDEQVNKFAALEAKLDGFKNRVAAVGFDLRKIPEETGRAIASSTEKVKVNLQTLIQDLNTLRDALKNVGLSDEEIILQEQNKRLETLRLAFENELIQEAEFNRLREKVYLNAQERLRALEKQESDKRIKQLNQDQQRINNIVNQGFTNAISGGIQNVVKSLAEGQNVFSNFADFIVNTFGDLAIQLGQFYIAQGIANAALLKLDPTATIAAGAALVALGSILKSFAGSGLGGSPSTAGVAPAGAEPAPGQLETTQTDNIADPEALETAQEQSAVTVNIDRFVGEEEEARRVAEILSDAGAKNGTLLTDVRSFA